MDIRVGDKLLMKKKHPCGADVFSVLRIGIALNATAAAGK